MYLLCSFVDMTCYSIILMDVLLSFEFAYHTGQYTGNAYFTGHSNHICRLFSMVEVARG